MVDVHALRDRLGFTQSDFALLLGVNTATVQRWERPGHAPTGPAALLVTLMEPPEEIWRVKPLSALLPSVHSDAWEHVGLYRRTGGDYFIGGNGGPDSTWGRKHGPIVWHREPITVDMAHTLIDLGGVAA